MDMMEVMSCYPPKEYIYGLTSAEETVETALYKST